MATEDLRTVNESEENRAMAKIILQKVEGFEPYRRAKRPELLANIAYLLGKQNIMLVGNEIKELPEKYATSVVCNRILSAVVNDVAVATKALPQFDVIPTSTDEADKATALVGNKLISYMQRKNGRDLGRRAAVMWYDIGGIGWRKVWWDPRHTVVGYNPGPDMESHNPEMDVDEPIFQGEVRIEPVANDELIFDWRVKDIRNLLWIIHAKRISRAEAKRLTSDEFVETLSSDSIKHTPEQSLFMQELTGDFAIMAGEVTGKPAQTNAMMPDDQMVDYYEFWHKPSANMPHGAFAIMVGNKVFKNEPYPIDVYSHGELPFVPAAPVSIHGISPAAPSRISQARPLQREYNRLKSLIADNLDAMGNSVIMAPRSAKVNIKKLTDQPGCFIEYDGLGKPTRESGVQIPGSIFAYIGEVKQGIDEIFAFPAPSRGMMPRGGPDSAKGLLVLQDAANTQLGPMVDGFDAADEEIVRQAIKLAITNYGERTILVIGKDNQWAAHRLDTNELQGDINIAVRSGSSMPTNRALEAQKVFGLWQSGLLGDPMDPKVKNYVLKSMDLGNAEEVTKQNAKQINFAKNEFINAERMAQQMPPLPPGLDQELIFEIMQEFLFMPPPNSFDNHDVHIQEHTADIMDKYWEYMAAESPALRMLGQLMIMHTEAHKQIQMQQMTMIAQAQTQSDAFTKGNTMEQIMAKQIAKLKDIEADVEIAKMQQKNSTQD